MSSIELQKRIYETTKAYLNTADGWDEISPAVDKGLLQAAMEYSRYNKSRAAKLLGISRGTLHTTLRENFGDYYDSRTTSTEQLGTATKAFGESGY